MDPRTAVFTDPIVGISEALDIDHGNSSLLKNVIQRDCGINTDTTNISTVIASSSCASAVNHVVTRIAAETRTNTARQLEAYLQVIKAMKAATGIKHLVVLSDGLGLAQDQQVDVIPIARAAAEAGVQMSVLTEEQDLTMDIGPPVDAVEGKGGPEPILQVVQRVDGPALMAGLETVSDMAGGNFYHVIGSADPFFTRVDAAASAVYRLGVEPPADSTPGMDFAVTASVKKPGLTVHANHHAVAAAPETSSESIDDQLTDAVGHGLAKYGVPISVATSVRRTQNLQQIDLGVNMAASPTAPGPITAVFSLVDDKGTSKSGRKVIDAGPDGKYRMSFSIPVDPGTTTCALRWPTPAAPSAAWTRLSRRN